MVGFPRLPQEQLGAQVAPWSPCRQWRLWDEEEDGEEAQHQPADEPQAEAGSVGRQRQDEVAVGEEGDGGEGSARHRAPRPRWWRLLGGWQAGRSIPLRHLHHLDHIPVGADLIAAVQGGLPGAPVPCPASPSPVTPCLPGVAPHLLRPAARLGPGCRAALLGHEPTETAEGLLHGF